MGAPKSFLMHMSGWHLGRDSRNERAAGRGVGGNGLRILTVCLLELLYNMGDSEQWLLTYGWLSLTPIFPESRAEAKSLSITSLGSHMVLLTSGAF